MADAVDLLRKIAHSLADVEETVACAGSPSAKKKSAKKKSAKKKSAKKR
jgi:hypothetical protein